MHHLGTSPNATVILTLVTGSQSEKELASAPLEKSAASMGGRTEGARGAQKDGSDAQGASRGATDGRIAAHS